MKKYKLNEEEYQLVTEQASVAKEILEDERFKFIREYFNDSLKYIEDSILNNTIRDVEETIVDKIQKTFFTPKKVQIDELSGQYKLINKFFEDLKYYIKRKENMEKSISSKDILFQKDE